MTLHAFIEYLKYRWKAMGRHGTHSPFVYQFIENVLLDKSVLPKEFIVHLPESALKYENLVSRVRAYFRCSRLLMLPSESDRNAELDMIVMNGTKERDWMGSFNKYFPLLQENGVFVVTDIHKTLGQSMQWKVLCSDARVRMSFDVYGLGLLFFRKEFKVKQDFVLKY